jgi:hypothetical protein
VLQDSVPTVAAAVIVEPRIWVLICAEREPRACLTFLSRCEVRSDLMLPPKGVRVQLGQRRTALLSLKADLSDNVTGAMCVVALINQIISDQICVREFRELLQIG